MFVRKLTWLSNVCVCVCVKLVSLHLAVVFAHVLAMICVYVCAHAFASAL